MSRAKKMRKKVKQSEKMALGSVIKKPSEKVEKYRNEVRKLSLSDLEVMIGYKRKKFKNKDWTDEIDEEILSELKRASSDVDKPVSNGRAGLSRSLSRPLLKRFVFEVRDRIVVPISRTRHAIGYSNESKSSASTNGPNFLASSDYRSVLIYGKSYALTGQQAKAIRILHENHERGTPEVGETYLLEELETTSNKLRDCFQKEYRPAYRALVVKGRSKGTVKLNIS